jgi:hypothetical protein|tara:strand:+ start:465 stop:1568 length:1104 start_codon:yes stop_codon:yes gene_type:complete
MSYQKTISGAINGKFDKIAISNTSTKIPIDINGKPMGLENLLTKQTITGESGSYSSLLLPKVHMKQEDILLVDKSGNLNMVVTKGDVDSLLTDSSSEGLVIKKGSVLSSGDHLQLKASPAPVVMTDTSGRLDSYNIWHANFSPYVLGYADADKPDFYSQGLVRQGSDVHENKFLRKDGQWGMPSAHTGSVAENFLSLNDTPSSYTDAENKYVRVTYEGGGKLEFNSPTTSEISEGTNLYYTPGRVISTTESLLSSGDLTNLSVNGIVNANSFVSTSDIRKKENIFKMKSEECDFICEKLQPCQYNLKNNPRKRYGFIAQEVKQHFPELVLEKEDGSLGIDYIDIIAAILGKTQDLQKQINSLKRNPN